MSFQTLVCSLVLASIMILPSGEGKWNLTFHQRVSLLLIIPKYCTGQLLPGSISPAGFAPGFLHNPAHPLRLSGRILFRRLPPSRSEGMALTSRAFWWAATAFERLRPNWAMVNGYGPLKRGLIQWVSSYVQGSFWMFFFLFVCRLRSWSSRCSIWRSKPERRAKEWWMDISSDTVGNTRHWRAG